MRNILILVMILAAGAVAISAQGDTPVLPAQAFPDSSPD